MIIDLDSHLRDSYVLDEIYKLEGPWAKLNPVRVGNGQGHTAKFIHSLDPISAHGRAAHSHPYIYDSNYGWRGGEIAARQVAGIDMEKRREGIKKESLDKEIIFPTQISIATQNIGPLGRELARCYNNWVAKLVKGYEDVFLPVAMAPGGCPEAMADELGRCVKQLGFKVGHLVPYCGSRNLDSSDYYSYYEAAQELNVPLFCHPNSNGDLVDRFDNFFKTHVLGRPMNCTPALIALVLGGIFEKFPKLKVVFFECSAEFPLYWMHRMDDDWEWAQDFAHLKGDLKMPPSEYVRRNCYFTCEADEKDLSRPIAEVGEDHILMATDYPHFDSEYPHTVSAIRARNDITAKQKDKILGENAARILNL